MSITKKEEFYLDPFEFIDKPRRVFMGLEVLAKRNQEKYPAKEKKLVLEIIEEAKKDFYAVTLPKFEKKIQSLTK